MASTITRSAMMTRAAAMMSAGGTVVVAAAKAREDLLGVLVEQQPDELLVQLRQPVGVRLGGRLDRGQRIVQTSISCRRRVGGLDPSALDGDPGAAD